MNYSWAKDLVKSWIEACKEIGIPYNPDINTPAGTISVSKVMSHINSNGERSSPSAYLPTTVLFRPNLDVLINTRMTGSSLTPLIAPRTWRLRAKCDGRAIPGRSGQRSGVERWSGRNAADPH
ncbi:hypothetical protein FRC06_006279, partial [Ceratobasidium sp. 370]